MANLDIYEKVRNVPDTAKKSIGAGRLKGMTDINPMWRIKTLTEQFGACGIGWYYTVDKQWIEPCGTEAVAFVNISLYIKVGDEWSKPIFGNGGSKIIAMERSGAYVSDEAYKMATTDAISVACKQLGMGADVYWQNDRTKYSAPVAESKPKANAKADDEVKNEEMRASVDPCLLMEKAGGASLEAKRERFYQEIKRTHISAKSVLDAFTIGAIEEADDTKIVCILQKLADKPTYEGK